VKQLITLNVNGNAYEVEVEPRRLLLDCLRDDLGITGPKEGCSVGVCGACTVLVNGRLVSACLELAVRCDGARITTIEGLAEGDRLHPIQQAFVDHGGFQCGICTPGMVLTTKALLDANPEPGDEEIRDWMMGSLCRCTGYYKILESIKVAAAALRRDPGTE
jgi:carbon-monoxide dehydrogenase small subunit